MGGRILCDGAAVHRRFAELRRRRLLVLGDAVAVEQSDAVFDLGVGIVGPRRRREQATRLHRILGHAVAVFVERGEGVLGFRAAGSPVSASRWLPRQLSQPSHSEPAAGSPKYRRMKPRRQAVLYA